MIGDNGSGKSTLAKVLSHQIAPSSGTFSAPEVTYLDQDLGLHDSLTIADVFGAAEKIAAFFDHPDFVILDEPTNNLDITTIKWLVQILESYEGAYLLVSHDEGFCKKLSLTSQVHI